MYSNVEIYVETIDWNKRINDELPLLKSVINSIESENKDTQLRIIDLGCGPGIQLLELAKEFPNYNYIGLDIDEEIINYAKQNTIKKGLNLTFRQGDFLKNQDLISGPFDFVFSLGNSLSLIWGTHYCFDEILNLISSQLNINGYLFFQILNNDNPRKGYKLSKIKRLKNEDEYFTLKRFKPDFLENIMEVEFLDFYRRKGEYSLKQNITKNSWKLVSIQEIYSKLKKNGFKLIDVWENYNKGDFIPQKSDNLLCLTKKVKK